MDSLSLLEFHLNELTYNTHFWLCCKNTNQINWVVFELEKKKCVLYLIVFKKRDWNVFIDAWEQEQPYPEEQGLHLQLPSISSLGQLWQWLVDPSLWKEQFS